MWLLLFPVKVIDYAEFFCAKPASRLSFSCAAGFLHERDCPVLFHISLIKFWCQGSDCLTDRAGQFPLCSEPV